VRRVVVLIRPRGMRGDKRVRDEMFSSAMFLWSSDCIGSPPLLEVGKLTDAVNTPGSQRCASSWIDNKGVFGYLAATAMTPAMWKTR
jgi:hypothetical protein